jgi:hypothetical protein
MLSVSVSMSVSQWCPNCCCARLQLQLLVGLVAPKEQAQWEQLHQRQRQQQRRT